MQDRPAKPFEIRLTPEPGPRAGVAVLELRGFLDAHAIAEFDRESQRHLDAGFTRLVLDTHDLTYISSAGIGSLVGLSRHVARLGGDLVLLTPPSKILSILELLDFTKILKIVATKEEALEALSD